MNGNIEVINENLWAINPYYVKARWIKELSFMADGTTTENTTLFKSKTGIFILNTAVPEYKGTRKLLITIMNYSDSQLKFCMERLRHSNDPATCDAFLLELMELERERRDVRAAYLKREKTLRYRVYRWIRKKVGKWHQFKQALY